MLRINKKLENKVIGFNKAIGKKYSYHQRLSRNILVNLIARKVDKIRQIPTVGGMEIKNRIAPNGIVGVDGSINTLGSSYPHYLSFMQAMAKWTKDPENTILEVDIHSPLMEEDTSNPLENSQKQGMTRQEYDDRKRTSKLAVLELRVAIAAIKDMQPSIVLMDGSLMRYKIYCGGLWDEFKDLALDKKVFVAGIIEEIKTSLIAKVLKGDIPGYLEEAYDREILFGLLECGQMLIMDQGTEEKELKKCFIRSSKDPHVIGMDMLWGQSGTIMDIAGLVAALTPKDGRGIPLWLDVVDHEVKISDAMMKAVAETYIDEDLRRMLFAPKREKRWL